MAYQRQTMPWGGQDYNIDPNPVYGQIKRGPAPPQYRFQGPRIGLKPDYTGANKPLRDSRAPAGTFTNMINNAANSYVNYQDNKRATVLRKSMKLARANNKVAALRQARALGTPPTGAPATTGMPHPFASTGMAPPIGTGAPTTLPPPISLSTPAPTGTTTPPWTGTPPPPPKTKKGVGTTSSPFDLPPLAKMGGDLLTQTIRNMPDDDTSPIPSTVEWKDEPTNPFPKGNFEPFDRSRMFDPTYKPSEEMTSPSSSRTKKRPSKPRGNELDEVTGPVNKEGNPIVDNPSARQKFF